MDGCEAQRKRASGQTQCPLRFRETLPCGKDCLSSGSWRLQPARPPSRSKPPAVAATAEEPLQEIVVTGSRIAAPNAVSTSPIQVISAESIATSGKTDISDLIMQLPQNLNNATGAGPGQHHERLDHSRRHRHRRPARARAKPNPGAGRRTSSGPRIAQYRHSIAGARSGPNPRRFGRANRSCHRRSVGRLRLGRHRRRHQLHHEEEFSGRAVRRPVQREHARQQQHLHAELGERFWLSAGDREPTRPAGNAHSMC